MAKQKRSPATRDRDRREKTTDLPNRWTPKVLDQLDGRLATAKAARQRYEALKQDTGADSIQKELLCQRAAFLSLQIETMEVAAANNEEFSPSVHCQLLNTFLGVMKALGLEPAKRDVEDLDSFLGKGGKGTR